MIEGFGFPNKLQDTLIVNPPKKSPLLLKMVVITAAMVCSVCICSIFLKQMEKPSELYIIRAKLTEKPLFHTLLGAIGANSSEKSHLMRVNAYEVTPPHEMSDYLVEETSPHAIGANLAENIFHDPELSELHTDLTEVYSAHVVMLNRSEKKLLPAGNFYLTNETQPNAIEPSLIGKPLYDPELLGSQNGLKEVALPHFVKVITSEIAFPPPARANLKEKTLSNSTEEHSHDSKFSESHLHSFYRNKMKTYSRDEHGCMPVSLYAIVSVQRSGSKWFEALLNNHDNIRSHGEIFYNYDRKCNMTVIKAVLDKMYSLNWNTSTFRRKKRNCMAAVGFKWMLNQGIMNNHKAIADYFNHRVVSVILLFRRNHLRRLVSVKANNYDGVSKDLNGTHKAHVNSKQEAEILARYKPKLIVRRLIPTLEHMERLAAATQQYFKGTRHMVVYYEDLVQNQTKTMLEVLEFLKASQRTLNSGHVKIHTRPLAHQIENWGAVVKVIRRSKFSRFITANDYEI